ncbi:MAG: DUF3662 domain-containing protein [Chloroflexi bacterium]|nr:DUF3662 domain-containing protein [Chloroflexota bacterium]
MGALGKFEAFVENLLEGSFSRLLGGRLQPVEVANRLADAMEDGQIVGAGKLYVPNDYTVLLSADNFRYFESARGSIEQELADFLVETAAERGFTLTSHPTVHLEAHPKLGARQMRVQAEIVDTRPPTRRGADAGFTQPLDAAALRTAAAAATPVVPRARRAALFLPGNRHRKPQRFILEKDVVGLGRGLENDIVIADRRISRQHAEIRRSPQGFLVSDLQSMNGTFVNGRRVGEAPLKNGDEISLGGLALRFELE